MFDKKEWSKNYNKNYPKTPHGKINIMITKWKHNGLKCESREDYELIYDKWLNSSRCDECNCEYSKGNRKCMDHCHDTGLFRNILCHSCNTNLNSSNTSGTPNICWDKRNNSWKYYRKIKGKKHSKSSKDLEWLKNYKKEFELKNVYIH